MDATTKKPKLTIAQVALGYKRPIDRSDRDKIDIGNFLLLFSDVNFLQDLSLLRDKLGIKIKTTKNDLLKPAIILTSYRYQANSSYLNNLSDKQLRSFEKEISSQILEPYNLNFNLLPVIEWYVLYDSHIPPKFIPGPNPKLLQLYLRHPYEFFRSSHTASDVKYFTYQLKTQLQIYGKPFKEDKEIIDGFISLLRTNKNKHKPLRDPKKRFLDKQIIAEWKRNYNEIGQSLLQLLQEKADDIDLPENKTGFAISDKELRKDVDRIKRGKRRMRKPKL